MKRELPAIVLVDEPGDSSKHYATAVEKQLKQIETRMQLFDFEGDIVICCGSKSMTSNKGKALCIVNMARGREMTADDEKLALIECVPGRKAYPLSKWRYFSRKFTFAKQRVRGSFQTIFTIEIPEDVEIID
jgi:hypothetical protein